MPKVYLTIYAADDPRNPADVREDELPGLSHQNLIRKGGDGQELVTRPEAESKDGDTPEAPAGKKADAPAAPATKDDAPAGRAGAPKTAPKE